MRRALLVASIALTVIGSLVAVDRRPERAATVEMSMGDPAARSRGAGTIAASTTAPPVSTTSTTLPTAPSTSTTPSTARAATPNANLDRPDPNPPASVTYPELGNGRVVVTRTASGTTGPTTQLHRPLMSLPTGTIMTGDVPITGLVRSPSGAPIAGACVNVWGYTEWEGPTARVTTDANGVFHATAWMHNWHDSMGFEVNDCSGAFPGFANTWLSILARPLQPVDVVIEPVTGNGVRGILVEGLSMTPRAQRLCVLAINSDINVVTTWSNADGSFHLGGLGPGSWSVNVYTDTTCKPWPPYGRQLASVDVSFGGTGIVADRVVPVHGI